MPDNFPAHWAIHFTPTIHSRAEGPTDPASIALPANFVVCVTGAGKGLGYHIALAYARAGAKGIAVSSRTQSDLDRLAQEIEGLGRGMEVLVQTCDTMKDGQVEGLPGKVWERWGRCDVVVANAGVISSYVTREDGKEYLPVGVVEDGDMERVVETNLMGTWRYGRLSFFTFFSCDRQASSLLRRDHRSPLTFPPYSVAKHFLPHLAATPDGPQAFIAITSVGAHMRDSAVMPFAYNLSKLGMNRMVEHIAVDHKGQGVQAFAVHPGAVLTPQTERHHETQMGETWTDCELCLSLALKG